MQYVRVNGVFSEVLLSSTGSEHGCVLLPLLFILFANVCQIQSLSHVVKFADDSFIVSLLSQDNPDHGPVLKKFIGWCKDSYLEIYLSKIKEMVLDFGEGCRMSTAVQILGYCH